MRRVGIAVSLAACGSPDTDFPAGLEPLEPSTAPWPAGQEQALESVTGSAQSYDWSHANAWVHAPLADVYACLQVDMVDVNRREVSSWEVQPDVEQGYEVSYRIDQVVENVVTVEYSDTWRHGSVEGQSISVWKMTEANPFMSLREGSMLATEEEDALTGLEIVGHIDATSTDADTIDQYHRDLFADLLACIAGEPYPLFD